MRVGGAGGLDVGLQPRLLGDLAGDLAVGHVGIGARVHAAMQPDAAVIGPHGQLNEGARLEGRLQVGDQPDE